MKLTFLSLLLFVVSIHSTIGQGLPPVFINEIHYWEASGFADPFIEIAGAKKTKLDGWSIYMYNNNGTTNHIVPLKGTINSQDNLAGALSFLTPNMTLNLALVREDGTVAQFLSILSPITATEGPADGMTSTYLGGVFEIGSNPINYSLQQQEQFSNGVDFQGPNPHSPGNLNAGIPSYVRTVSAATITNIEVNCISSNETTITVDFHDAFNAIRSPYRINIPGLGDFPDVAITNTGINSYETSVYLGMGILEGQHKISLFSQEEGNESEVVTTYVAVQSCGHPSDLDNDGIVNENDNCPFTYNHTQQDVNNDGIGDACAILSGANTGSVGVGTELPKSKLQIDDGDIYVENIYRGIVLRSANGNCFRVKPDDDGILITTQITCPN